MGGDPVWVPELARPLYHAALTIGSNHLVTLVNDALDLLDHAGVEEPARLIAPLLSAALDNVLRLRDAALTGPVVAGRCRHGRRARRQLARPGARFSCRPTWRWRGEPLNAPSAAGDSPRCRQRPSRRHWRRHDSGRPHPRRTARGAVGSCPARWAWCPRWAHCTPGTAPCSMPRGARTNPSSRRSSSTRCSSVRAEDLDRYPRTLDADVAMCAAAGVDVVWAPSVEDVYVSGPVQVTVSAGPLGDILEGAIRPGHFAGMLTVVAKLINSVRPDRAYFGEKDYQQLTLVRRMVARPRSGRRDRRRTDGSRERRAGAVQPQPLPVARATTASQSPCPARCGPVPPPRAGSVLEAARDALAAHAGRLPRTARRRPR